MALLDAPVGFALAAGTVAAFNPCGFAMLPAYLSFFISGGSTDGHQQRGNPIARALLITAAMTVGFVAVFGLAGLAIEGASVAVGDWTPWITLAIGIIMMPLGIAMVAGKAVKVNLPRLQRGGKDGSLSSMGLFGASYATVSLSCTLPVFLTAVSGSFRNGNILGGMATYLAYAVGMGLVIGVLTVALALAQDSAVRKLRAVLPHLNRIAGGLLVIAGAYVAWYGYFEIRTLRGDRIAAGPVTWVTDWSAQLSTRLDAIGTTAVAATLAILTGIGLLARRHHNHRPATPPSPATNHGNDHVSVGKD
ncbi:MAG: cytochrome c biogenesis CcdA family protein [Acidimicrobiales bacterium]